MIAAKIMYIKWEANLFVCHCLSEFRAEYACAVLVPFTPF